MTHDDDVLIAGAGFAGLLVARELLARGRRVTVIERGGSKSHAEQLADRSHELDLLTARHNHEAPRGQQPYPWNYVYGVGGSSLHWTGVAPRLLPNDFRLRSAYGVGRDWPIAYEDLASDYERAEHLLLVAGELHPDFPSAAPPPLPAHPLSPVDRLVGDHLQPYRALPQARLSRPAGGRPACCGNGFCALCPVDARQSMLHLLESERMLENPSFTLVPATAVAVLRTGGGRVAAVECIDARRERSVRRASTVVLAAGGIENAALLLRSSLEDRHTGRWLYDHGHRLVHVRIDRSALSGRGASHITGLSYAWADGPWRSERASQLLLTVNQGALGSRAIVDALAAGRRGAAVRAEFRERAERLLVFDLVGEDLPAEERRVELSSRRDALGLPRSRVHYGGDSSYLDGARARLYRELEDRLRPLGGKVVEVRRAGEGSHQLGTCFMGDGDGVVDRDLRHHRVENLFVVGGSAFPSYSAHHPTLTICALALRLGRTLAGGAG